MTASARDRAIRDAYAAGASLRTIAAQQSLSHETVRKVLRDAGVVLRTTHGLPRPSPSPLKKRDAVFALARRWPGVALMEGAGR